MGRESSGLTSADCHPRQYHRHVDSVRLTHLADFTLTLVKPSCQLLIRYMALLFVPIGVGVMQYYEQLTKQFGPIVVSCFISTLIVMLVVAYSSHYVHRDRKVISPSTPTEGEK